MRFSDDWKMITAKCNNKLYYGSMIKNANSKNYEGPQLPETLHGNVWEHTGSNRGPSACKADALNQLSYAPFKGLQR
jgi:hypothetical protein